MIQVANTILLLRPKWAQPAEIYEFREAPEDSNEIGLQVES